MSGLTMLDKTVSELVAMHGPFVAGETRSISHVDCGDRRKRLYITRTEEGTGSTYLGFCHNCGKGGRHNGHSSRRSATLTGPAMAAIEEALTLPAYAVELSDQDVPRQALQWAVKALHLDDTPGTLDRAGWLWDRSSARLVMPIYAEQFVSAEGRVVTRGDLLGYQLRRIFDYGPKYLTVSGAAPLRCGFMPMEGVGADASVVLVEDWASAYAIARTGHAIGIPLFGSSTTSEHLVALRKSGRQRLCVWLDNDNPQVLQNAAYLERLATAIGFSTTNRNALTEPKLITTTHLASIVESL